MQTYGTGKGFLRVQATLNQFTPKEPEEMALLISTEKLSDALLRLSRHSFF
jgi:hypothetical protein